jgi:hypothetical protein
MLRFRWPRLLRRHARGEALAPEQITARAQWLEIFIIPLLVIAVGWITSPKDPMLSQSQFPWFWFAPVLISLRYGVLPGLLGSIPILVNWLVADRMGLVGENFSSQFFFGAGVLVLLCGEFSDVWRDRNARMEETYLYVTERLSRLTKRHLLLNLSHDRLEQEMLARPGSLRDALARLRAMVIAADGSTPAMPAAQGLLQLLSQYVNIESAALYVVNAGATDPVLGAQIAFVGEPATLEADDELLRLSMDELSLSHIASRDLSLERKTNQLVVAPLISGNNTLIGVLAVTRMPFFSLNVENLQMMSVILAYYADNIRNAPRVREIQQQMPSMPALFAEELVRMLMMQDKVGISSHIVLMTFDGPLRDEIPAEFLRIKRGLDLYWQTRIHDKPAIAVLMPFASPSAKEGFIHRIDSWLHSRFHGGFDTLDVHVRTIDFDKENPLDVLLEAVRA